MKEFEILAVGKNLRIMQTILRLINGKPQLNGTIAASADEAIEQSKATTFSMVLLGAGLDEMETEKLCSFFTVPVVQHYGGGSGLLFAEIYQALNIDPADKSLV